jgi:multidrug efflux system membrane fusion protein
MSRQRVLGGLCCVALMVVASGCEASRAKVAPAEPPVVPVSRPVEREVTDYVDFTGRTEAVHSVDIKPRVTGYLTTMPFKEGSDVKAGDLLFIVDQRPYQAQLDQAQGQVDLNQASLKLARVTLRRDKAINSLQPGSISQQQFDQEQAVVEEAEARVKAMEKAKELYLLNKEFTRIVSPIDGQISRYYLTLGNLVNQDTTLLTTVVSVDPMYAYFEMDEPTLLKIRRAVNEGKIKVRGTDAAMPVSLGLQGEDGFPHQGAINFVNNQMNSTTGSILVRGVFANPRLNGGHRLLSPGMFGRIRLPIGQPHPALLVIDRAISSDQGLKYVYVIDPDNTVQYRRITTGPLQDDGLRVIETGLEPTDWVVVGGLQQLRPRMEARAERVAMPAIGPAVVSGSGDRGDAPAAKAAGAEAAKSAQPSTTGKAAAKTEKAAGTGSSGGSGKAGEALKGEKTPAVPEAPKSGVGEKSAGAGKAAPG